VCVEGVEVVCGSDLPDSESGDDSTEAETTGNAEKVGADQVAQASDDLKSARESSSEFAYDLIAMPVLRRGEVELTRELMQQGHERLALGGFLAVSVDNPKDQWLHEQMQALFDKVTCHRTSQGSAYWGKKTKALKKLKDFSCQFAFRDEDS